MNYLIQYFSVLVLFFLSGCAILGNPNRVMPIPSLNEYALSFRARMGLEIDQKATSNDVKRGLVSIISEYHGYAVLKRRMEWEGSGITTLGGIAAVLGALADRTGLTNAGAAVAGIGLVSSSRFKFQHETLIYTNATKRFACIYESLGPVPETVFSDAATSDDKNAASIASGSLEQIASAIDRIRIDAANQILSLAPATLSREELTAIFRSYGTSGIVSTVVGAPDPTLERRREAGEQVKRLLVQVELCTKL